MISIRELEACDLPALRGLAIESETDGFRFLARFVAEMDSGQRSMDQPAHYFVGAFIDNTLTAVGGVTLDPYTELPGIGRIRHVYVARDSRRNGIGRALVTALEAHGFETYATLRLRTDTPAAAKFYESLGYERTGDPNATHLKRFPLPASRLPL